MERSKSQLGGLLRVLFILTLQTGSIYSSNILFYYGVATHSHRTAIEPLAHKLAERGHNITFLAPVKPERQNPKIKEFVPQKIKELYESTLTGLGDTGFPERLKDKYANWLTHLPVLLGDFVEDSCHTLLQSPDLKPWLNSVKFDLVIIGHAANKCAYAFAYYWNASVIMSSANTMYTSEEDTWGAPLESSWLPRFQISNIFTNELTYYDRVYNVLNTIMYHLYCQFFTLPKLDKAVREFMKLPEMPHLSDLERFHTSLVFLNQHFSEDYARSLPPMFVPVGGMHCTDEHKSLPQDLEEFIQGAGDDGFVFVSFGSMVKMSMVPEDLLQTFFDGIKDLKVRFLWRWDKDPPDNLPPNVLTRKWFPQQDLLAHPRIKGFISHGGLMSTQQAIFHAVPLIVMPIVFDQPFNARKIRLHGIGIHLELSEITTENFRDAILNITQDNSLKARMKQVSSQFRDRPMSAVDTAVYWTEYVIRHGRCDHMKPLGIHQPWWQRRLLDVWLFVFLSLSVFLYFLVKFTVAFVRALLTSLSKAQKLKEN